MSEKRPTAPGGGSRALRDWRDAGAAVFAGLAAMVVVAALGLWAAGAADLPGGAFPSVLAATVVTAVGGSVDMSGGAGAIAEADAGITALPLSVSLVGALATGAAFLLPLRHRAVATTGEMLARAVRAAALWLVLLILLGLAARHEFPIDVGDPAADLLGEFLDADPTIGFRADLILTVVFGLLWLVGVLVLAFAVSRKAPLPSRLLHFQEPVRPVAFAMLLLLLVYVAIGLVIGLVVAATQGNAAETFAVILLGLPNVVWLAFGVGLGASWEGRVEGTFGLPMPQALAAVLRTQGDQDATLNVSSLAEQDGRAWLLPVVAGIVLLTAAVVMAVRSPAGLPPWRHAVHLAVALAVTMLVICLLSRISAHYGLSVLGIGDIGGLGGRVFLRPNLWAAVGIAAGWGLVAGFLGGLIASRVHRRGGESGSQPSGAGGAGRGGSGPQDAGPGRG